MNTQLLEQEKEFTKEVNDGDTSEEAGGITEQDFTVLYVIMKKMKENPKIKTYELLPESIKEKVDELWIEANSQSQVNQNFKITKENISRRFINSMETEITKSQEFIDIEKEYESLLKTQKNEQMGIASESIREVIEVDAVNKSKELKEKGDDESLQQSYKIDALVDAFKDSYNYRFLYNKIKNKPISTHKKQLKKELVNFEKHSKKFDSHFKNMNYKLASVKELDKKIHSAIPDANIDTIRMVLILAYKTLKRKPIDNSMYNKSLTFYFIKNLEIMCYYDIEFSNVVKENFISLLNKFK